MVEAGAGEEGETCPYAPGEGLSEGARKRASKGSSEAASESASEGARKILSRR